MDLELVVGEVESVDDPWNGNHTSLADHGITWRQCWNLWIVYKVFLDDEKYFEGNNEASGEKKNSF